MTIHARRAHARRFIGVALAACVFAGPVIAAEAPAREASCARLADMNIADTNLLSAAVVPAGNGLPAYCRVLGFVRPAINFEIRLPTSDWNGKFYMVGCGGLCGVMPEDTAEPNNYSYAGLQRHYAVAVTDTGHWGESAIDGRWAYQNPVARADWAYRSVNEVTRVSKLTIAAYYDASIVKSYFNGCSNGGRQGLIEAQRFPADFDGIVAGAPAIDFAGVAAQLIWTAQADSDDHGQPILDAAKFPLVRRAVAAACGDQDGIVADPRLCHFTPSSLECRKAGQAECLTAAEVAVLEKWYAGSRLLHAQRLPAAGIPFGSEPSWRGGLPGPHAGGNMLARELLRYFLFDPAPGQNYEITQFDFDRDPPRIEAMADMLSAADPDLEKYRTAGGKLIVYQGWADVIVSPQQAIAYFEDVQRTMGARTNVADFMRLFMVPGMNHCGWPEDDEPGVDMRGFDPLTALEQWVEHGLAPTSIPTAKIRGGHIRWKRPVCAYPQVAVYRGSGNRDDADSWKCAVSAGK